MNRGGIDMKCTSKPFGTTKGGEDVVAYTMTNKKGSLITVLNYGGTIQRMQMPDKNGTIEDVVLGFDTIKDYEEQGTYFGCIIGRVAGRLSNAAFEIEGEHYQLNNNEGANNLHSGPVGLDKRIWHVAERMNVDSCELMLSHTSPHLDQGFPGTLDMVVTYKFDEDDCLKISYKASTDIPTILTLTNHSYFNLTGDSSKNIENNRMCIPADQVMVLREDAMPTGLAKVENTPFDFRQEKLIGQDIDADDENIKNGGGYNHAFILNKDEGEVIVVKDAESGRQLTIETTEACVVCYTANGLKAGMNLYGDKTSVVRGAVCLETQYYPDAINQDCVPSAILRPGEVYRQWTTYQFSTGE